MLKQFLLFVSMVSVCVNGRKITRRDTSSSFLQRTFAQKCQSVNRNQLSQSCMICNRLLHNNFLPAHGSRITAACSTLSRNQCCMSAQNDFQESRPLKLNGHMFHYFALV